MILRQRETGMVLEQVEITPRGYGTWHEITGVVRDPGASKFAVGQRIAWPYDAGDWEEVGGVSELNLDEIRARLAAVPDTELRALSNDPFNSELTICKVIPLESNGPIKHATATAEAAKRLAHALQQPGVHVVIVEAPCVCHCQG